MHTAFVWQKSLGSIPLSIPIYLEIICACFSLYDLEAHQWHERLTLFEYDIGILENAGGKVG